MQSTGYKIGAYGSGLVCSYLLDEKLLERRPQLRSKFAS